MATKRYGAGPRHSITSPVKVHSIRPIIGDVPMRRGRGSIPEVRQSHGRTRTLMPHRARLARLGLAATAPVASKVGGHFARHGIRASHAAPATSGGTSR